MKQEKSSKYIERSSLEHHDTIGKGSIRFKLEWHKEKVSDDKFHFHCWVPKNASAAKRNEMLAMFKKLAPLHGEAASYSWDFIPPRRRKKVEPEPSED